jgi:Holliday junction resolvase RusA-like endonuclease
MVTLSFIVRGRPAPQGSHEIGANGHVMHSSRYLENWRELVKRATYRAALDAGYRSSDFPLFPAPAAVQVAITHFMRSDQCRAAGTDEPTGAPDVDKLARATIDGLGASGVLSDDSQITVIYTDKRRLDTMPDGGAFISISDKITQLKESHDMPEGFTHDGEYQLVLSRTGTGADGERTWETVIDVTDLPDAIAETWLPAIARRIGRESAPAAFMASVPTADGAEEAPKRKRRTKAEIEADRLRETEAAPTMPTTAPDVPGQVAVPAFNPFAKPA